MYTPNADDAIVKGSVKEVELGTITVKENDIAPVVGTKIEVDPYKRPDTCHKMMSLSFMRRIWGIFPLLVSLLNTINKTYDIGAKLASKTPGGSFFQYEPYLSVYSCSDLSTCGTTTSSVIFSCDDLMDVQSVTIQCPVSYRSDFQGIVAIWSCIFGGYILYYLAMTAGYSTWDLRYYIAEHHAKVNIFSTIWKVTAITFTIICTIYGFWSVKSQDQGYAADNGDAMLYMSTILFAVFNIVGIMSFFKLHPSFTGYKDHTMASFPDCIAIKHVKEPNLFNLYGGLVIGGDVFSILELAIAKSLVEHTAGVEKYCLTADDASKTIAAFRTMEIL